jgi:hypothetical protein
MKPSRSLPVIETAEKVLPWLIRKPESWLGDDRDRSRGFLAPLEHISYEIHATVQESWARMDSTASAHLSPRFYQFTNFFC